MKKKNMIRDLVYSAVALLETIFGGGAETK